MTNINGSFSWLGAGIRYLQPAGDVASRESLSPEPLIDASFRGWLLAASRGNLLIVQMRKCANASMERPKSYKPKQPSGIVAGNCRDSHVVIPFA